MPRALRSKVSQDRRRALNHALAQLPREVTTAITWRMKQLDMSKAELARKMGVSPGRVSQILSGDENITLHTLASVCVALDAQLDVKLVPNDVKLVPTGGDAHSGDALSPVSSPITGMADPAHLGSSWSFPAPEVPTASDRSGR
jgi:transcriptional regulator with XRE-family HTH domain